MASSAPMFVVDATAMRNLVFRTGEASKVCAKPLGATRGQEAVKILRNGTRGIRAQFNDQAEYKGKNVFPWKKGHDFGIRKAPAKTMQNSGAYRSAFLGGVGNITEITANSVKTGVSAAKFPQVKIHQGRYATRRIKPKQKITSGPNKGQWKMRFFLGLTYGVWMKNSKLSKGLSLARRRVSVSNPVKKEISKFLRRDITIKLGTFKKFLSTVPS